jgi:hypothetical protein
VRRTRRVLAMNRHQILEAHVLPQAEAWVRALRSPTRPTSGHPTSGLLQYRRSCSRMAVVSGKRAQKPMNLDHTLAVQALFFSITSRPKSIQNP